MMRGTRRGCVRLKGAVVGIDDDDDSTFTITVDSKTFHFQVRDYYLVILMISCQDISKPPWFTLKK